MGGALNLDLIWLDPGFSVEPNQCRSPQMAFVVEGGNLRQHNHDHGEMAVL